MSEEWRNDPATAKQKAKLAYFRCTWDEGITKGQASDALDECVKNFPEWEFMYANRPATDEQKELLRQYGKRPLHTITYARAREIIKQCEGGWQPDMSKYIDKEMSRKPPRLANEDFEEPLQNYNPAPSKASATWRIIGTIFLVIGQILTVVFSAILLLLVSLLGFKTRRRRRF